MKARRILLVILLIAGILAAGLTGASCAEKQKTVSKIEIIDGSFEEVYAVDQKIDFAKAKILVTYTDRTTATIPVTQEMVSGFDTSVVGRTGTITVTYQGKTATFAYRVQASGTSVSRKAPHRKGGKGAQQDADQTIYAAEERAE